MNEDPKRKTMTEIDSGLMGTAKIDPDRYSAGSNANFLERTKFAVAGLLHLLVHHPSIRYIVVVTLAVYVAAWWLGAAVAAYAVLTLALGQLWLAEVFNTALEALTDLTTEGSIRSLAKVTKDVAAAGTFIASGVVLIVCMVVLVPLFLARF